MKKAELSVPPPRNSFTRKAKNTSLPGYRRQSLLPVPFNAEPSRMRHGCLISETPGMIHRVAQTMLELLIGTWAVRMTVHDEEGRGTISDSIRSKKEWFGGQYVRETISGEFAGKPHNKLTILAFNATRGRYEYVTADDNDTVILLYTSLPAQTGDGNRLDLFTEYLMPDRQSGKPQLITIRTRFAIQDRNRHTLRNFYIPPAGKEHPFLQYEYARLNEA